MMPPAEFPVTRWSVVITASGDDAAARTALAELCEAYWYPLYSFVRRSGKSPQDAEDLTQAFFARLVEKETLGFVQKERGKLRSFLLQALKNFLSDEWDKANALKRGGGTQTISIDAAVAEERYAMELPDESSPDRLYQRRWAVTLLKQVLEALQESYHATGKEHLFEELHQYLASNAGEESYRGPADRLGMSENAVRVAVFRMRQRYAAELRRQIAETVETEDEVTAEIDFLFQAVRFKG